MISPSVIRPLKDETQSNVRIINENDEIIEYEKGKIKTENSALDNLI